ncbi:twin-arginine translocation signal domain-containing protein [Halorussus gelatinilyticus]|uniref:Twin-arginine translocation signal domain-containing protein n=1 Tax=Halorussus gelatinilyticus TaxID=2937524 RepID=A0A8U0IHD7_9EURY|nr:twin-arginine translocation signal domain-containing protein [Halorussus gelatinilyticus]UPV99671.1 twin-arginine translocation signal domain-containing protein [Halorussus gelatinilyticus]
MVHGHGERNISDEQRREFLKALGAGGAVAAGGATLGDVRDAIESGTSDELASVGEAIRNDLAGSLDADLLAKGRADLAGAAADLTAVPDRGVPGMNEGPREEFAAVASAARPTYEHLGEVGFFESTTERLPEFAPEYIEDSVRRFVVSDGAATLSDHGFSEQELVDLLATVVGHRERIGERHWVATDQLPREQMEMVEHVPAMTKAAAGGVLLWLEDLDEHIWTNAVLLTDDILADAAWDARAMAAGFDLMADGARRIAEADGTGDEELAGLLSSGFALQTIAQNLLPEDAYWIDEQARAERNNDLEIPN